MARADVPEARHPRIRAIQDMMHAARFRRSMRVFSRRCIATIIFPGGDN
jgi:hypothetical protein